VGIHEGEVMNMKTWIISSLMVMGFVAPVWGVVIEKPVDGQTVVIGVEFDVWIRPESSCKGVVDFDGNAMPFNSKTGRYEWKETLPPSWSLGKQLIRMDNMPGRGCRDAAVTINVVLPSTTTVQKIDAHEEGEDGKKMFLRRTLTAQKELFRKVGARIEVEGFYSDGVKRSIAADPKTTYQSLDEKIATVEVKDGKVVVTPVGRGETEIVVSNGPHQDRLKVYVDEVILSK
jgi:hypothetical protein